MRIGNDQLDWDIFHELYTQTATRLNMSKSYRFDRQYFTRISDLPRETFDLVIVEDRLGDPVSAAILLYGEKIAHYHLGASDLSRRNLRPNDFLYLAMARAAQKRGCERIVWGGGVTSDPNDTLFRFKSHFGSFHRQIFVAGRALNKRLFANLIEEWAIHNGEKSSRRMFLQYRA